MKVRRGFMMIFMMVCLVSAGVLSSSDTAYAQKITSMNQAKKKALKKVKNAVVTEVDKDYEKGILIYEIHLVKGTKEYEITYRASDGKTLSYGWEEEAVNRYSSKAVMSKSQCKKLARKKVSKGKITSITKKLDDGIYVYKVKMKKGSKKYTLKYHARTRELLEYEWELVTKTSDKKNNYIGREKARQIALAQVPGAVVVKIEFDKDDGVPVYEVELIKDEFEYEIKIHAKTGKILDIDKDFVD